ncbi:uncharacterized protein SAPINGB_P005190 [Magnusiomyces paraingens]|uniref:Wings apart-like protein C-terminal domain-containing protein n=1 Tax=Magnusiomyces paraingens TaxID=2606893 RepID=A0A5E8C495_9ASCO|nr:uncharacterized protein SAPINGB_P005190 [Saprochaete ingens]VVT56638.1 unnamed protein product [Saprochaete ingens]
MSSTPGRAVYGRKSVNKTRVGSSFDPAYLQSKSSSPSLFSPQSYYSSTSQSTVLKPPSPFQTSSFSVFNTPSTSRPTYSKRRLQTGDGSRLNSPGLSSRHSPTPLKSPSTEPESQETSKQDAASCAGTEQPSAFRKLITEDDESSQPITEVDSISETQKLISSKTDDEESASTTKDNDIFTPSDLPNKSKEEEDIFALPDPPKQNKEEEDIFTLLESRPALPVQKKTNMQKALERRAKAQQRSASKRHSLSPVATDLKDIKKSPTISPETSKPVLSKIVVLKIPQKKSSDPTPITTPTRISLPVTKLTKPSSQFQHPKNTTKPVKSSPLRSFESPPKQSTQIENRRRSLRISSQSTFNSEPDIKIIASKPVIRASPSSSDPAIYRKRSASLISNSSIESVSLNSNDNSPRRMLTVKKIRTPSQPTSLISPTRTSIIAKESVPATKKLSSIEQQAWSFLDSVQLSPPQKNKKQKFAQLSSLNYNSDSESETEQQNTSIIKNTSTISYDFTSETQTDEVKENTDDSSTTHDSGLLTPINRLSISRKQWSTVRATYSGSRRYGSERSYLADSTTGNNDNDELGLIDQLAYNNDENSSNEEENDDNNDDFGGNLKTVYELRAIGGNTKFTDEVQYILDGLGNGVSGRRSSLLELAEKCIDPEFAQEFRASSIPGELFTEVREEKDVISTFLVGFLVCTLVSGDATHAGLAAALVQSYGIIDVLMDMVDDTDDISRVVFRRQIGASRIFQQLFRETLTKFYTVFADDGKTLVLSRSLVALTALSALEKQDERVEIYLITQLLQKKLIPRLLSLGETLEEELLPVAKHEEWKISEEQAKNDTEKMEMVQGYLSQLYLLNMISVQIEYLSQNAFEDMLILFESDSKFLFRLPEFMDHLCTVWKNKDKYEECNVYVLHSIKGLTIEWLKILILVTSNVDFSQIMADPHSRRGRFFSRVYDMKLAAKILDFLSSFIEFRKNKKSEKEHHSRAMLDKNMELFAWGLLVNLCESSAVTSYLLTNSETLSILKILMELAFDQMTRQSSLQSEPEEGLQRGSGVGNTSHGFHCRGYQFLVLGIVMTKQRNIALHKFSASEKENVQKGLREFEQGLSAEWGRGLRSQVTHVLKLFDEATEKSLVIL